MIHAGRRGSRGAKGWWPSNSGRRSITVAGVDPVAAGTVAAVDRTYGRPMAGTSGTVVAGESFTPGWKATLLFSYAKLALTPMVPASRNRVRDPNIVLPATSGDRVGLAPLGSNGTSVLDSLSAIPPGIR